MKCPTCKFGARYDEFEDIPVNESLVHAMKQLHVVKPRNTNKNTKALRLAKRMVNLQGIIRKFEAEKRFVNKMFEESDSMNPYPVCERFFFEGKCDQKEKCIRLHISQEDTCEDFHNSGECKFSEDCQLAHVTEGSHLLCNAAGKKVKHVH